MPNHSVNELPVVTRSPGRPRDESARLRIQEAAIDLLIEGGFLSLTCDAIAQRAGTSKATIYRWWPNKVQVVIDAFTETLSPSLPISSPENFEDFLRIQIPQFIQAVHGRNGRLLAAVVAAAQVVPEVHRAYIEHWIKPRRQVLRKLFRQYQANGSLTNAADPDMLIDTIYGALQMLLLVQPERMKASYAADYVQLLLHGLLRQS